MGRVYDMSLVRKGELLVYHNCERGPLTHSLIDLVSKTSILVLEYKELGKVIPLNYQNFDLPICLVIEQFLGPRLMNMNTE